MKNQHNQLWLVSLFLVFIASIILFIYHLFRYATLCLSLDGVVGGLWGWIQDQKRSQVWIPLFLVSLVALGCIVYSLSNTS